MGNCLYGGIVLVGNCPSGELSRHVSEYNGVNHLGNRDGRKVRGCDLKVRCNLSIYLLIFI